ncbi:MAG: hypothetical protein IJ814_02820 [Paludibacteraceae bacterium]|nr:hypothetical protein [Paludibacteraceae bacterium]
MMKKSTYIVLLIALAGCAGHVSKEDLQRAEKTLAQADSLENTIYTYADTLALQEAVEVFSRTEQTAQATKAVYHLGKAYLLYEQDSVAALCFRQAADEFLTQSDSVYYPLSILELSLIAERSSQGGNTTMLQAIRNVQRKMIYDKAQSTRRRSLWRMLLAGILVISAAVSYLIFKRRWARSTSVRREDLERNIELVLSQGNIAATLHWREYNHFCKTANAYLYNIVDKLQAAAPQLTEQDIRFLVLVLLDLPAKEIADIMNLSQNSISNKKTRTAQKLGTIAANLRETIISITLKATKQ